MTRRNSGSKPSTSRCSRRCPRRDIGLLDELLADDVEFRSYATGPEPMHGKSEALEAVKATRDRILDLVLLGFEHLGDGWLIAAAQLRHTAEGGWMADSRKAALARVVDAKVHVSLASSTVDEVRAEFAARQSTIGRDRPRGRRSESRRRPRRRPRRSDPVLRGGIRPRAHPAPSFGPPVAWLRAGSLQLHLTETQAPQPSPGHFALEVDDFGAVYRWATDAGVLSRAAGGPAVFELPGGECQLYLHDPGGNVVEVCHPDAARWREQIPEMVLLADLYPQNADAGSGDALSRR